MDIVQLALESVVDVLHELLGNTVVTVSAGAGDDQWHRVRVEVVDRERAGVVPAQVEGAADGVGVDGERGRKEFADVGGLFPFRSGDVQGGHFFFFLVVVVCLGAKCFCC